jgi:hypothetical protein
MSCNVCSFSFWEQQPQKQQQQQQTIGVMVKAWIREVSHFVFLLLKIGGCRFESFLHRSVDSKKKLNALRVGDEVRSVSVSRCARGMRWAMERACESKVRSGSLIVCIRRHYRPQETTLFEYRLSYRSSIITR